MGLVPDFVREDHQRTARQLLAPFYSDTGQLDRAVGEAVGGTVRAFLNRANGETDEAGQQEETLEALLAAVEEAPPDQPTELVRKRLRLRIQKLYGKEG